jgi:hypothetical protein
MAKRLFDNAKFSFVGELSHGQEPMSTKRMGETSKWFKTRLSIGVKDGANSPFLAMEHIHEGATPSEIRLMTNDIDDKGKRIFITVPYSDSSKPEISEKIADFLKITIDLETDFEKKAEYTKLIYKRMNHEVENNKLHKLEETTEEEKTKIKENEEKIEEYTKQIKELATKRVEVHMKDAIELINKALPSLKGKKVRVTGTPKCNYYNGKNQLQYIPSVIELVPDETPNQLKLWFDLFYEKDSIDDDKKEKKLYVNGYIGEVKDKQNKLYPISIAMDYSKVDESIPEHKMLLDLQKSAFEIKNKKSVYKNNVEVNVINGAEQIEFTEDCLTEKQKMQVKLGLAKLEQFKPKGNTYGDRIQELKFYRATLKGDYSEGSVEVFDVKELPDYFVKDDSDVKETDVEKDKVENTPVEQKTEPASEDLMSKLFG